MVRCPAHADGNPSLSITEGTDQPIILHCHAGCLPDAILAATGLSWQDITSERSEDHPVQRGEWTPNGPAVAVYDYTDEAGVLLSQVLRTADKGFSQRVPDAARTSGWRWSLGTVRRVLYRLPAVIEGVAAGGEVYITEGEKDADNLFRREGVCATTSIGGAGKWRHEYATHLVDASVTVWSDADDTGRAHARTVRQSCLDAGARQVRIVESASGKDATDHLDAGLGLDDVLVTHPYQEEQESHLAMDLDEYLSQVMPAQQFVIHETLARGEVLMVTGFEGFGKALALDTPIPTPDGMVTMGSIREGCEVYAMDGSITRVTYKSPVFLNHDCYQVLFDDGSFVIADAEHLWLTETRASREATAREAKRGPTRPRGTDQRHKRAHHPAEVTTEAIRRTLTVKGGANHSVAVCGPLEGKPVDLPLDPYTLGAWLGDGHTSAARITNVDPDVVERIRDAGWIVTRVPGTISWSITGARRWSRRDSFLSRLRMVGVYEDKHIPEEYLTSPVADRLALTQGLMDTDGHITPSGACEYVTTRARLAEGVTYLLRSLGIKVTVKRSLCKGRTGEKFRLTFITDLPVFHLPRKAERITTRTTARQRLRYIVAVDPVPPVPVQCLAVEHESHTYLVTERMIPTHNTTLMKQLGVQIACGVHPWSGDRMPPSRVLYIDAENKTPDNFADFTRLRWIASHHTNMAERSPLYIIECGPLDLGREEHLEWFLERVRAHAPDVLVIGPVYNLVARDLRSEDDARVLKASIDAAQKIGGCAVIMEHHVPHGGPEGRDLRPIGSSLLMRWPNFGFGLSPIKDSEAQFTGVAEWQPWRGGRRRNRRWPQALRMGTSGVEWMWEQADPRDVAEARAQAGRR